MLVIELDTEWNKFKLTQSKLDFGKKRFYRLIWGYFAITFSDYSLYAFVRAIEQNRIGWYS